MSLDRNLLIEAGAGTGKTTRLVKSVLQALLIRQIPLEGIVALTFTNKAAGELKDRVGSALEDVLRARAIDSLRQKPWWPSPEPALPLSDLQKLAQEASGVLDRADISTIHSFAFALLKRFPLASGIDPDAAVDDKGLRFDEIFAREWPLWLTQELGDKPPQEKAWLELLSKLPLVEVGKAAKYLADFRVPLEYLTQSGTDLKARLVKLHAEIRSLCAAHPSAQKADAIAHACEEVIGAYSSSPTAAPLPPSLAAAPFPSSPAACGGGPINSSPTAAEPPTGALGGHDIRGLIDQSLAVTNAWPAQDIARLKLFQGIALNLLAGGDRVIGLLTEILTPFLGRFRDILLAEGCLTHSALLYLSREIVKKNSEIRAALKRRIRFILIDEFQDTDPLQAELLLYLAEKGDHHSQAWEDVELEPGKLFIVGDPKQSIYRFRGADIAAYERIGKLLVDQGGARETLAVNYRSQSQIIHAVNQAFERLIRSQPEISPPYVAVQPHHPHEPEHGVQNVEIWLADSAEEQTVEEAQKTEAEHIARWIAEAKGKLTVFDPKKGERRPLLYLDVSLIFRTYSPMDRYIEALRRHHIPFAVESERYFFTTPEVTDFINLLRAADDTDDLISLVGFLRGPMAGLTDEEILQRKNAGTLEEAEPVRWLRTLTERLRREPLADVLQHLFAHTYLMELAARSYHGDQTVANLLKFKSLLEEFASEGVTTMGLLLKKLDDFFDDDKIEGESPLADENYNAVRLLTIHKAKGLEYPVVFLPSLHSQLSAFRPGSFVYDWRTQELGLKIAQYANLNKLLLDEDTRLRETAEQNRVLYVAMTRARERLVLSGGLNLKANKSNTYLQKLLSAWDLSLEHMHQGPVRLTNTEISVQRLERVNPSDETVNEVKANPLDRLDLTAFATIWKEREEKRRMAEETLLIVTPTLEGRRVQGHAAALAEASRQRGESTERFMNGSPTKTLGDDGLSRSASMHLGTLVHRFLEEWDFSCEKCSMPSKLRHMANSYFTQEGLPEQPDLVDHAQQMLARFIGSEDYNEIKGMEILGREIPFFYQNGPSLMRGTMDILYRLHDRKLVIGDYKTGSTSQTYATQAAAYQEAVRRALGEEAVFKIIALREDNPVTL